LRAPFKKGLKRTLVLWKAGGGDEVSEPDWGGGSRGTRRGILTDGLMLDEKVPQGLANNLLGLCSCRRKGVEDSGKRVDIFRNGPRMGGEPGGGGEVFHCGQNRERSVLEPIVCKNRFGVWRGKRLDGSHRGKKRTSRSGIGRRRERTVLTKALWAGERSAGKSR